MCLLVTLFAAIIASIIWYTHAENDIYRVKVLAAIYWGASLMWGVDCVADALDGKSPFSATADDFLLAGLIVASGLAAFAFLRFMEVAGARKKAD
jgi:hypothetical protein